MTFVILIIVTAATLLYDFERDNTARAMDEFCKLECLSWRQHRQCC